jgi:hypothetical protein
MIWGCGHPLHHPGVEMLQEIIHSDLGALGCLGNINWNGGLSPMAEEERGGPNQEAMMMMMRRRRRMTNIDFFLLFPFLLVF